MDTDEDPENNWLIEKGDPPLYRSGSKISTFPEVSRDFLSFEAWTVTKMSGDDKAAGFATKEVEVGRNTPYAHESKGILAEATNQSAALGGSHWEAPALPETLSLLANSESFSSSVLK